MIGTKRKLIVPVVAIMMCAVALAGVAYAAVQTAITSEDSSIDYGAFQIELTTNGTTEVSDPWFSNAPVVDFGRVKTISTPASDPTWNVALHSAPVASAKIKVNELKDDSTSHSTFTLGASIDNVAAGVSAVVTFKVQYSANSGETWTDVSSGVANLSIGTTYDVRIVATLVSAGPLTNSVYQAFVDADKTLDVTFTADVN